MKKNKGFTLIELLAVLVILAIIALIITPIVTNLIKDARIRSAEDATEGLLEAVHVYYGRQVMLNNGVFNDNKKQTVEFDGAAGGNSEGTVDGDTAIEFNGFKVTDGSLTINRYGKVQIKPSDQLLVNGYYCINNGNKAYCDETEINPDDVGVYVTASELLTENVVTSGDGLYADSNNPGEYYYRGANPDNYIQFNNEVWRIMSIESTGEIKIIKDDRISLNSYEYKRNSFFGRFDANGLRNSDTSTYCDKSSSYACNAWSNMQLFVNGDKSGIVNLDAPLNVFLNSTYKNTLSSMYQYIQFGMTWNIGPSGTATDLYDVSYLQNSEASYLWTGDIALPTKSEYIRANKNNECLSAGALYASKDTDACTKTNYLYKSGYWYWLLSPGENMSHIVLGAHTNGQISQTIASNQDLSVRPALYLKSSVILEGNGTNDSNIYKIVGLAE